MKAIAIALAATALSAAPALADITCWYNEKGDYTGADSAQPGWVAGQVRKGTAGDYAWGYTVPGGPDTCPRKLPRSGQPPKTGQ
ncbi:MAG: hypothetical protein KIT16_02625 [Rhodospirillaceae bacterium]|nr:hypothetical protein [Rhodospirillaceae bacterium]